MTVAFDSLIGIVKGRELTSTCHFCLKDAMLRFDKRIFLENARMCKLMVNLQVFKHHSEFVSDELCAMVGA